MNPTITKWEKQRFSRRGMLGGLGALAVSTAGLAGSGLFRAGATPDAVAPELASRRPVGFGPTLWEDPRSWPDGRIPGPADVAEVTRPIIVTGEVTVAGINIQESGLLVFSPSASTLVRSRGNVIVEGELVLHPLNPTVTHTLRFIEVDEASFVGGHTHHPLSDDVGLWILDTGLLDAVGGSKLPWTRLNYGPEGGDRTLTLTAVPSGWEPGDVLVVTPTQGTEWDAYDRVAIQSISGRTISLAEPLNHDHPAFDHSGLPQILGAEVLNLTRNVRIEGTAGARSHVQFLHTKRPQHLAFVELSFMAPEQVDPDKNFKGEPVYLPVEGRYALHFHMCEDWTVGSQMEGIVARDCGGQLFVTHESHGVDWVECIGHDNFQAQYWWDRRPAGPGGPGHPPSNDVRYIRCVASLRRSHRPVGSTWRNPLFDLLAGTGNATIGCVAVGSFGTGFHWPEGADSVWRFEDCISHNCRDSGLSGWQNSRARHILERFVIYRCGGDGAIQHGAYSSMYLYRDALVAECDGAPLMQHATNRQREWDLEFENIIFDASGYEYAIEAARTRNNRPPTLFTRCTLLGYSSAAVAHAYEGSSGTESYHAQLTECNAGSGRTSYLSEMAKKAGSEVTWSGPRVGAALGELWFSVPR